MPDERILPQKLTLEDRKKLTMTGVSEVLSFDESAVVLKTTLGQLTVHGRGLKLKNLSLEGGQVGVDGQIDALIFAENKPAGGLRRLFR